MKKLLFFLYILCLAQSVYSIEVYAQTSKPDPWQGTYIKGVSTSKDVLQAGEGYRLYVIVQSNHFSNIYISIYEGDTKVKELSNTQTTVDWTYTFDLYAPSSSRSYKVQLWYKDAKGNWHWADEKEYQVTIKSKVQPISLGAILLAVLAVLTIGVLLVGKRGKPAEAEKPSLDISQPIAEVAPTPAQEAISPAEFIPRPTTPSTFPPELLPKYTDVEYLGKGGFARVFKAKRKSDGKLVAVKIPISLDEATGKSFLKEIKAWEELKHENIVELYDLNIMPIPYFEMEYVENKSFEELKKPIEIEKAAKIIFGVAEGLKYAHGRGIIHRDLKPQNVLLTRNLTPKISDWGLSKVLVESKTSSIVSFSPLYAAPEQVSPKQFGKPDNRTDIYGLGVIFYELVTGRLPFSGESIAEISSAIISEEPEKPSKINPEAKGVEPIIVRYLVKKKEDRYQSADELQKALTEYLRREYKKSLKESSKRDDLTRSRLFCGDLILLSARTGDYTEVLKYLSILKDYAKAEERGEIENLWKELNYRLEEGIKISEELVNRIKILAYKVQVK